MMWSQLGRLATTAATQQGVLCMGLLSLALTAGCSDPEEPKKDKCADVMCERGVCDGETGECANADECEGDATKCLEGYECAANGQCTATVACDPTNVASCARGECVAGACVDKDTCAANADCVEGKFCDTDSTCKVDPCMDGSVTCARGACETGTGMCLNANACTDADEATTCLEGFKCGSGGKCLDEAAFCAQLNCGRGVCDFDTKSCISATDCGGSDMKCVEGEFCNPQNTCQVNSCDAQMKMCDRGVCDRATAECINPATCTASANCLDGNLCVGGVCVEQGAACGAAGCEGNQVCEYDAGTLSAACAENMAGCQTSGDCLGERVCRAGVCEDAQACTPDALEPNDDSMTATALTTPVSANICGANADFFTYDATGASLMGATLVVTARLPQEDVGAGNLKVVVTDKNGVTQMTTSDSAGLARVSIPVTVANRGAFGIEVSGEGAGAAGLRYQLSAAAADSNLITACMAPAALTPGMPVTRNSNSGGSVGLIASCADPTGVVAEDIYTLTVAQTSYVTLTATPAGQGNIAISVQTDCLSGASELPGACVNAGAAGAAETFGRTLQPGTYFVVVQGPAAMTGGSYTLNTTVEAAICTQADNSCKDANTASLCNERGTAFIDEACDNGCDAMLGRCNRPVGEACYNAIDVDETMTFMDTITWTTLRNDFDPGATGCVPEEFSASVPTDGPDKVYVVDVPPQSRLDVTLLADDTDVSLYILTDCADVGSCVEGVNDNDDFFTSDEEISYVNDTMSAVQVFVVADVLAGGMPLESEIAFEVNAIICTPSAKACAMDGNGNDGVQTCNATGTAYLPFQVCSAGCNAMTTACNPAANNSCVAAVVVTPGVQVADDFSGFAAVSSPSCVREDNTTFSATGRRAIYKLNGVQAGQTIRATLKTSVARDTAVWISNACDMATGSLGSCLLGGEELFSSTSPEVVEYAVTTAGDYYIAAQLYSSFTNDGPFTLDVELLMPICTPGAGVCSTDMMGNEISEVCAPSGLEYLPARTCSAGCDAVSGLCNAPPGDRCDTAVDLMSGVAVMGNIADYESDHTQPDTCTGYDFEGRDGVWRLPGLTAGQSVTVTYQSSFDGAIYVSMGCNMGAIGMCLDGADAAFSGGTETLTYPMPMAGDLYIVAGAYSASTSTGTFTLTATVN